MCRAGGRRCPSHTDPQKIAARNQRRREQYAKNRNKTTAVTEGVVVETATTSQLTPAQVSYFKNTVVKTEEGNLIPLYHGSAHEFTSFNPELLGRGNDSWGNGFYFTDQRTVAEGYMKANPSPTANVKEFYLNLQNPIVVDGKENMSLTHVTFPAKTVARILKKHPEAYIQPDNEEGDMSFLGDYAPEYWDKEHHSKQELEAMIDKVAAEYFDDASWVELENVFGKDHGAAFLNAMHEETGHDGVIVDFGEDGKHYVAWFPNQMKLTTNQNPDSSNNF